MIYTGEIDAFCGFVYGELPYRSMHFEFKHISRGAYQEVAQVNYPNDHDFTRITEFKHMTAQQASATTIAVVLPRPCREVGTTRTTRFPCRKTRICIIGI